MHRLLWAFIRQLALAVVVLCGAATFAHAQSAKELFDQGVQELNTGHYPEAVQAFDASYRKEPTPVALYNLGLAYKAWGHPGKALEAFEGYVQFADPKKDRATIDAVRSEIARIKNGYGRFALKLTPADASIQIDGKPSQANNGELWVQTGQHKISITAPDYEPYEQTLQVAAGRFDLEVNLRKPSGPPEERAAALVDEGVALQAAGKLPEALDKYHAADQIMPTPRGTGQMGLTEESIGDLGKAQDHINAALKSRRDPWIRENRKKLRAALRRIKRNASTLDIRGEPLGAEVFVNGRSQGTLPFSKPVKVAGGNLTVTAKKEGYDDFEEIFDLPPRAKRIVEVSMHKSPPPVVAPVPIAEPEPKPEPVPALQAQPVPQPLPEPKEATPPEKTTQSDIEALTEPQKDLVGEPPPRDNATGLEMALDFGYMFWIGGPKTDGSSGALTPQILLGARVPWFLSFGLALNGGFDLGTAGTKFVINANPGLYVRGHIQRYKKPLSFDGWAGTGIQPVAMQIAVLEAQKVDLTTIDPNSLDAAGQDALAAQLVMQQTGASSAHTVQSINLPLELGGTFYITESFGVDLTAALTFWFPQQSCIHARPLGGGSVERLCTSSGLKTQTSLFLGGGLSFLP